MKSGDLIGFRTKGFFAAIIRLGQRVARCRCWDITHIAIVADVLPNGDAEIIQSVRRVNEVFLSSYGDTSYIVIPFPGPDDRRPDVVAFARSYLGRKYGVLSVLSRAWNTITPRWVRFGIQRAGDLDCAGLVARAFEHGGVILEGADPAQYFPGQLADEFLRKETNVLQPR